MIWWELNIGLWVTLIYIWRSIFLYRICGKIRVFWTYRIEKNLYARMLISLVEWKGHHFVLILTCVAWENGFVLLGLYFLANKVRTLMRWALTVSLSCDILRCYQSFHPKTFQAKLCLNKYLSEYEFK